MTTKATNVSEGLEPCPFCGGEAKMEYDGEIGRFDDAHVECLACKTIGPLIGNVEGADAATAEARRLWNTRASPPLPSPEVERLREGLEAVIRFLRLTARVWTEGGHVDLVSEPIICNRHADTLENVVAALSTSLPSPLGVERKALADIEAERRRQVEVEGWTAEHDDAHAAPNVMAPSELAEAAACYAVGRNIMQHRNSYHGDTGTPLWPWESTFWKPRDHRSNLIRAGALIVAEIERLDRAALSALPLLEDRCDVPSPSAPAAPCPSPEMGEGK